MNEINISIAGPLTYLQNVCNSVFHTELSPSNAHNASKINIGAWISTIQPLLLMMATQPALSNFALKAPHV